MSPLIVLVNTIVLRVAPKEKSGSAASMSETGAEVGAALGIAVFGSLLAMIYRLRVDLPEGLPESVTSAAEQGMPSAAAIAEQLPAAQAGELLAAAENAFTTGLTTVSYLSAAVALVLAILAALYLRPKAGDGSAEDEVTSQEPERAPAQA
ncbi:hypothetical protein [Spiractinospora alimapuensis]|uniref:hypothetical protein n=1 Tax=Spiractinospora alimapuensis TaxID=2820884 RepID=UPI001F386F29|nr:hypothetical protein [Spiractinospora alimapuensis]